MRDTTKIVIITLAILAVIGIAIGTSSASMYRYGGMMGGWQKDGAVWSDNPLTFGYGRMMGGYGHGGMISGHGMMFENGNPGAYRPFRDGRLSAYSANGTYACPWTIGGR